MSLANNIRQLMDAQEIKEHELARRVGISQPAINKILKGKTTKSRYLPDIANVLGVTLEELQKDGEFDEVSLTEMKGKKIYNEIEVLIPKLTEEDAKNVKRFIEIVIEHKELLNKYN